MRKEFKLVDPYEHELHTYLWEPQGRPKGVVQIIHGAGEHVGRYDHFAQFLVGLGLVVIGNDHLGHGKNNEDKDIIYFAETIGFHKLYEGVKRVRDYIEENYPKLPVIMFAHSMGSFIGRYTILYDHKRYDQALFSGTALAHPFKTAFAKTLGAILAKIKGADSVSPYFNDKVLGKHIKSMYNRGFINKRIEWITQDKTIQQAVLNDPLCNKPFTIQAQLDILSIFGEIQNKKRIEMSASSTAIYFISGDLDALGHYGNDAKELFDIYQSCGYSNVKYSVFNNTRHEVINSIERQAHYKSIGDWMLRNL